MDINAIIHKADQIAREVTATEAMECDRTASWVQATMNALKEEKLTGLVVPASAGGLGHGLYALVRVCEKLGATYASAGLCYGMHCVGTAVIAAKATDWQREQYLEPIARGEHLTTLALSEAGTGAHFYSPQTKLVPLPEGGYEVTGHKTFVTNAGHVDSYVLSTMAAEPTDTAQFSCIVVQNGAKGIGWGTPWNGLGMRGNASRSMMLDNVRISDNQVLGEKGDQLWYLFNVVAPYFLMAMSGTYLGIAEAALQEARRSVSKRTYSHNGIALSSAPIVQHRLGNMWAEVEAVRQLLYKAAMEGDRGNADAVLSLLASKALIGETVVKTVNEALTLVGGIGYQENSFLGMLMRDARAAHVMTPTTELLYTWIGRALLDQPILSD